MNIKITGVGSYIPEKRIGDAHFAGHTFLNEDGTEIKQTNEVIITKFKTITGINERRYAENDLVSSDLGYFAAKKAIENAGIDKETIDYIIVAHNFGDIENGSTQADMIPSLASRVKNKLQIVNPKCVAYDLIFGCPGWIEGVLQANAFIKSGMAKKCLVIGSETLSRVVDKYDRDAMIYSDGAGASIIEASLDNSGLLSYESASYTTEETAYLYYGKSYNQTKDTTKYIKMYGRKIYEFALKNVPLAMKSCLEKSGISIENVSKILIHQANEKMDEAIVNRFYKLFDLETPKDIMPMSIHDLGNSSVATVPTLLDLLLQNKIEDQSIKKGDILLFASVGAGMNINAFVYRY